MSQKEKDSVGIDVRESVSIDFIENLGKTINRAIETVIDIIPKAKNSDFSAALTVTLEGYSSFANKLDGIAQKHGVKIKSLGALEKISARIGLQMDTLTDSGEDGTIKIIIERLSDSSNETLHLIRQNENTSCAEEILNLAREYASFEEDNLEKLKNFL